MATHPTGPLRYVSGAVNLDDLCLGLRALGLVVLDGRLDGVLCQHRAVQLYGRQLQEARDVLVSDRQHL